MSESKIEVSSIEDSVNRWPQMFKDLNEGGDTRRWQKLTISEYAPAALFGQDLRNGITIGASIEAGEQTLLSFPCWLDDDPVNQPAGPGEKVKFNGKARQGVVLITEKSVILIEDHGRASMPIAVPRERVERATKLTSFKLSKLSMTSAGHGYEILFTDPKGGPAERALFRLALDTRNADGFDAELRRSLGLT
jgi:hypothetical protein